MAKNELSEYQRLELIVEAVKYCQKVRAMGMDSKCYSKALREPIHFLWERRAGKSKPQSPDYRSVAALGKKFGNREIVYDHAVPFKYLQEELLEVDFPDPLKVKKILSRHCTIAIITKEEDSLLNKNGLGNRMPQDWDGRDPLARYKKVGIQLVPNEG